LANYGIFEPAKLIFTRLDEMQNSGAMIETAIFGRIPISYVSDGQRVPEDLAGAEKSDLLDPLLPRWTEIDSDLRYSRTAAA
jgi:flagellar biosynthesis protein FlhF